MAIVLAVQAIGLPEINLQVESATLSPLTYQRGVEGQIMTFDICIRNDGDEASGEQVLYFTKRETMYYTQILPLSYPISSIAPGQTLCGKLTFEFPQTHYECARPPCNSNIGFYVDGHEAGDSFDITIVEALEVGPDLLDAGVEGEAYFEDLAGNYGYGQDMEVEYGDQITIHGSILNGGTAPAGAFQIVFYASKDRTIDPTSDHQIAHTGVFSFELGAGTWRPFHAPRVITIPAGTYYGAGFWIPTIGCRRPMKPTTGFALQIPS